MKSVNDEVIKEFLTTWTAKLDGVSQQQRGLRGAVVAFAEGRGADPSPLLEALNAMRDECDGIFRSLIWLIRDDRSAT